MEVNRDTEIRKLNILFLSHERKMGGANISLFELVKELKNRGHKVCVAVLFKNCPLACALREEGIDIIPCFYGWWQMPANWNIFIKLAFRFVHLMEFTALIQLKQIVKKRKIDVIYSNTSCIDIGMKLSKATGIRHVWHFREFGMSDYGLEYLAGREKSIQKVNEGGADKVIFISKELRTEYVDINTPGKQIVIYNGVSPKNIVADKKHSSKAITFLVSGNLNPAKNQLLVLQAMKKLKDRGYTDCFLLIAGDSTSRMESQNYKKQLQQYIEENGLGNVQMPGYINDMIGLRRGVDVEIIPSVREAFGRVTIEAMMSGNPVIASDTGANPELVTTGHNGWLFSNGNADELADIMIEIIDGKYDLDEMGSMASDEAAMKYTISHNAEMVEKVLLGVE